MMYLSYYSDTGPQRPKNKAINTVRIYFNGWAGHVAQIGEGRGVHRVLVGKPEGKRPLERPRPR